MLRIRSKQHQNQEQRDHPQCVLRGKSSREHPWTLTHVAATVSLLSLWSSVTWEEKEYGISALLKGDVCQPLARQWLLNMELLLGKEQFAEIPPLGGVGGKFRRKTDLSIPSQAEVVLPPQLGTRLQWGCNETILQVLLNPSHSVTL